MSGREHAGVESMIAGHARIDGAVGRVLVETLPVSDQGKHILRTKTSHVVELAKGGGGSGWQLEC